MTRTARTADRRTVLVTGAGGFVGRGVIEALADDPRTAGSIVGVDVRPADPDARRAGVEYVTADVRSPEMAALVRERRPDVVVHLAAIVQPGGDREFEYSVDVQGTRNVLEGCVAAGVGKIVVTSSGAAYGYHADSPAWLDERDALRGNPEFSYSDHKRLVEEMLARYRKDHPALKQLVLRPGTILGRTANNAITNLFDQPVVFGLWGVDSPFVIIWDRDVIAIIVRGIVEDVTGIYNLAGDGAITLREMAALLHKPYVPLPVPLVEAGLAALRRLGLTRYGPEQVMFLRYRPVLSNRRLKTEFGYTPRKTSREVFEHFLEARTHGR